jgi:uncharacterized protein
MYQNIIKIPVGQRRVGKNILLAQIMELIQKEKTDANIVFINKEDLNDDVVFDYLKNIYAAILYKDIIARHNIRNVGFLDKLILFIADNTGSILSAKSIIDFLKSQKISISHNVILDYLNYLCNALFLFKVKRNDFKEKKILEFDEKYYFEGLEIRNAISGYKTQDINKILENVVFIHLLVNEFIFKWRLPFLMTK